MLDKNDLRFDLGHNGKIHVRYGKGSRGTGHKPRWVPMLSGLDKLLEWYLEEILPGLKIIKIMQLFSYQRLENELAETL